MRNEKRKKRKLNEKKTIKTVLIYPFSHLSLKREK